VLVEGEMETVELAPKSRQRMRAVLERSSQKKIIFTSSQRHHQSINQSKHISPWVVNESEAPDLTWLLCSGRHACYVSTGRPHTPWSMH